MAGDKIRLRFRKTGVLRLLSHLDMVRGVERMLRRADLPFRSTAGFHPTPRMIFALSLPLGADGLNEVLEIELTTPLDAEEVRERLNRQAPGGLEFLSAKEIPLRASAVPRSVVYTLGVPGERVEAARSIAERLLTAEKLWVDRYKPRPRRLNIRPYLRRIDLATHDCQGSESPPGSQSQLVMDLWVTQTGTARADELLKLLDLFDLLDAGFVLARSELTLRDETPSDAPDGPPDGPPETAPLDHAPADAGDDAPAPPEWGLSPNGPVVE
ncbi:MAG: TIGR03936 family radical SAM-associated protein [Fimbriiglobus sp.]|jgi:radical SAM-linked protein|nr:TIGR03936 family radical SAM-associated protein [Fimbriiglobus sp.]